MKRSFFFFFVIQRVKYPKVSVCRRICCSPSLPGTLYILHLKGLYGVRANVSQLFRLEGKKKGIASIYICLKCEGMLSVSGELGLSTRCLWDQQLCSEICKYTLLIAEGFIVCIALVFF